MSTVQIDTTQNVRIDFECASLGLRIAGWFIDAVIITVYIIGVLFLLGWSMMGNLSYAAGMILYLPLFFYDLLFEYYFNGQSPAKMMLKIKVIRLDGSAPSFTSYFLRWVTRFVDITFTFGGLAIMTYLITGKGQRMGDLAAGTAVVHHPLKNLSGSRFNMKFPESYRVTYPEVRLLNDDEIRLIKEVIDRVKSGLYRDGDSELVERTAELINKRLGISLKHDIASLQMLVNDYYFITVHQE
ncbi:MAG: RDD family protein [Ignavibacteriales bacterium]